jgi:hypothetical protein
MYKRSHSVTKIAHMMNSKNTNPNLARKFVIKPPLILIVLARQELSR